MNGAAGRRVYGFCSTLRTENAAPSSASASRVPSPRRADAPSATQSPFASKSRPCATRLPSSATSRAVERAGCERPFDVPVVGGDERHPRTLALDDESRRDGLHAPGGEPRHDLLPEDRRDLVAVEAVEDAPRLLRVDEPVVDVARVLERALDRVARDLVEDHAPHRHLRLQHLEEVPCDRLALAVLVGREQQLVGVLQPLLQVGDRCLLLGVDDVERLEVVVDVHAEPRPLLLLVFGGDVGRAFGEVADVPDARLHVEVGPEKTLDGACFCR